MGLNVVALVSGGKDSMFSILHCIEQGHSIVALANLYPQATAKDGITSAEDEDLNSFMFQTAGHSILPLYEKALGLPIYRQEIIGTAREISKEYTPSAVAGDETEDLFNLLTRVEENHPEINAVSTGAILSTYQRTRVESVALRLGLIPLGYLWQYPALLPDPSPAALLSHMGNVGIDARIVKVASGGLDESFLWKNVCDARTVCRLEKAMARFGGSVLGEGGEFETLVVSGPPPLWKGRLLVDDHDRTLVRGDGSESFLHLGQGSVELASDGATELPTPIPLFDEKFERMLKQTEMTALCQDDSLPSPGKPSCAMDLQVMQAGEFLEGGILYVNNLTSPESNSLTVPNDNDFSTRSMQSQSKRICESLSRSLTGHGLNSSDIIHATILLRSMSDFGAFNSVYGKLFTEPLPPSRVTVACGDRLPSGADIVVSVIANHKGKGKDGLHVQTRSYWAPANIGPYSQARTVPTAHGHSIVFVAGQIPLVPASMERHNSSPGNDNTNFAESAALSLQHLWRIGAERGVGSWTGAVAYLTASDRFEHRVEIARQAWVDAHRSGGALEQDDDAGEDGSFDIWDQRNLKAQIWVADDSPQRGLPDFDRICPMNDPAILLWKHTVPGFFAVEIAALPRECSIEWSSTGLRSFSAEQVFSINELASFSSFAVETSAAVKTLYQADSDPDNRSSFKFIEVPSGQGHLVQAILRNASRYSQVVTIFLTPELTLPNGTKHRIIPCSRVAGLSSNELLAGIILERICLESED